MRDNVVLPAPDGEDSTSMSPRRAIASLPRPCFEPLAPLAALFKVLHLLAELLDQALELEPDIGELEIVRLGAQRVGLAVELLRQEVEPAADRAAVAQHLARLRHVRGEPVELLAHVGLAGHQDRL